MNEFYIIKAVRNNHEMYYAIDYNSGGYPYWDSNIQKARIFTSLEAANETMDKSVIADYSPDKEPPRMLYAAMDLCTIKPVGTCKISICKFTPEVVSECEFTGFIEKKSN